MWPRDQVRPMEKSPRKIDWMTLTEEAAKDSSKLDEADFQEGRLRDHIDMLQSIDAAMGFIYLTAQKECESYFESYKKYLGTEFATTLRPRIRWRPGRPVELSWVKKVVTTRMATASDLKKYTVRGVADHGVLTRLVFKNSQPFCVKEVFKFIPRGSALVYSKKIFEREAGWVGIEGYRLERFFYLLRQEMKILTDIKWKIGSMHTLKTKAFQMSVFGSHTFKEYGDPKDYIKEKSEDDLEDLNQALQEEAEKTEPQA